MLQLLAPHLSRLWGPFRLFNSHLVLIGIGAVGAFWIVWRFLPPLWRRLPRDRGRAFTPAGEAARGKPTGAGIVVFALLLPVLFLVMRGSWRSWELVGCLALASLTGFLDDRSRRPWGEYIKGTLDLVVAVLASVALCQGQRVVLWMPVLKYPVTISPFGFVLIGAVLLWVTMNATNCTDGVDGLAGTLTLLSLFYLGVFLYVIVGNATVARYLLVPHNAEGARWAILVFTVAGALGGYLWHNAEPSRVMMGDAGSRFLGLLVGMAVLAAGNPFLVLVVAPVVLVNGGTGLGKVVLLRALRRLGFDIAPNERTGSAAGAPPAKPAKEPHAIVRALHSIRFPLHDHCRKNLGWSNAQVVLRFVLIQAFLTPLLLTLLIKVR